MTRDQARAAIAERGGRPVGSVSHPTHIPMVGTGATTSAKYLKGRELHQAGTGIQLVSEAQLLAGLNP